MAQRTYVLNSIYVATLLGACGGGGLVTSGGDPVDSPTASGGQATSTGGAASGGESGDGCDPGPTMPGGEGGAGSAVGGTPVARHGHLRVEGTDLVDESGEAVHLRGVSSMWLNWENDGYARSLTGLMEMRDKWGATIIRAAMGVDVDNGYASGNDVGMVNQVNTIVENAETLGMYVIVDFHSHNALDYQAEAIEFFTDISTRYGHLPNLILEPFNEPLDVSWTAQLKPYHEAVVAAIREADPDEHPNVAILGTPNWDQDITDVIGQTVAGENLMYAVHFYSCDHGTSYLSKAKSAHSAGIPIFVTEWGATKADGGIMGTAVCGTQADPWLDWMEQERVGWTAWKLDNCAYELDQNGVEDTSCFFKAGAPVNGGWTDADLNGHAPYVISRMGCN